jgi:type I restriction enzyme S subunit
VAEMMFYKETNFKETSIGKVPKEWKVVRAIDVARYINGYAFGPEDWKTRGVPIIRIQNLNDPNAEFNYFDGEIDETYRVNNGDLLFSWSASIGVYIWKDGDAVLNQHIFKVIPDSQIDKLFLYYVLFLAIEQLRRRVHGSTMKHFRRGELKTTLISLPSLSEQQKIAEVLSTVDEAIQKTNEIIVKTERLKKGLMQELLTRGIGHKEFKDTEIGRIPKDWEVVKLGDIVEINRESKDPRKEVPNETFLYIDIESIEGGTGKIRNPKKILGRNAPSRARRVVHENDVIMSTVRPYLKAFAIVPKEYDGQICSTGFAVLSCKNVIFPYFLLNVLFWDNIIAQCNAMMVGGQYPALTQSHVSSIKVPLPSLSEQRRIAEILSTVDKKLELERNEKVKLERIKQVMMDLLLTGKIRVRVEGNG